jgi:hypothetical protein
MKLVKESLEENINESFLENEIILLLPFIGVLGYELGIFIGDLYTHTNYSYDEESLLYRIKRFFKENKENRIIQKIAKRLKNDQDVQEFINKPNKSGWQKMLESKLLPEELEYLKRIYRSHFK